MIHVTKVPRHVLLHGAVTRIKVSADFDLQIAGDMAQRRFVDSAGVEWLVWPTLPTRPEFFADWLRSGWLTFDSASDRRRLAPIPPNWEDASVQRLELMCRAAEPTRRRTPPGQPSIDESETG